MSINFIRSIGADKIAVKKKPGTRPGFGYCLNWVR